MKYYLTKVIFEDKNCFLVWYSGRKDGFVVSGQQLAVFSSVEEAGRFAEKEKFLLRQKKQPMISLFFPD